MNRRTKFIMIDTETCPLDVNLAVVVPSNMFCYDIGWVVTDRLGTIYERRSFVNADVFLGEKDLMKSSYYAEKIPKYWEDIKNKTRVLTSFYKIRLQLLEDIQKYNVKKVFAHNMRFDYVALNNTQRYETKSKYRFFFPLNVEICDTLKMARQILGNMPTYKKFCEENNFMTKHSTPRPRYTAEIIYRFITKDLQFIEEHTGLEDVMIETEILKYCYRQHKKVNPTLR